MKPRVRSWKKCSPANTIQSCIRLPRNQSASADDLDAYRSCGIRHVTSFAVFLDDGYVREYGEPEEVNFYGRTLRNWQPRR